MTDGDATRLRVALLAFDFPEVCVALANGLSRTADVTLLLPERLLEPVRVEVAAAVALEPFVLPRLRQPLRQAAMCRRIHRTLERVSPDVVHLQQGHLWFNLSLPLLRVPLVVSIHDVTHHPGDRLSRKTPEAVLRLAWRRADQLIVHTERARRVLLERTGIDGGAVHVVPHVAIGLPGERPPADGDGRSVLFFGRIWPYKGLDYLIRAQPLITRRVPDARIVVAGHGEDLARYRALMRDPSRFSVIDEYVPNARRSELFAQAAVVVLPYVEASQSGVVPIAYAFGKPVVVTEVGGLPETVEHGRTGLVVPPRDERALAGAVCELLEQPVLAQEMGAAGRRKLDREWSPARVAERTLPVYGAALRARAGRARRRRAGGRADVRHRRSA
jgi:glycosyltransferase involved in cell wall biosynthesis